MWRLAHSLRVGVCETPVFAFEPSRCRLILGLNSWAAKDVVAALGPFLKARVPLPLARQLERRLGRRLTPPPERNHNGDFRMGDTMPTTLTLKNIPDEVYLRLKASAESHRRSLNSEAIVCLESVLLPGRATAEEVIARARLIRDSLPKGEFSAKDIDAFKREGRP